MDVITYPCYDKRLTLLVKVDNGSNGKNGDVNSNDNCNIAMNNVVTTLMGLKKYDTEGIFWSHPYSNLRPTSFPTKW